MPQQLGISANTDTSVRRKAYHCRKPLKQTNKNCRISANSFRGNYSFLKLFGERSQYISIKFPLHKPFENRGNYSREETIQGRKLFAEIRYAIYIERNENSINNIAWVKVGWKTPNAPVHRSIYIVTLLLPPPVWTLLTLLVEFSSLKIQSLHIKYHNNIFIPKLFWLKAM